MITVLYFASIRESLGVDSEQLALPNSVMTVEEVVALLVEQHGEKWADTLKTDSVLAAINQTVATMDSEVTAGDEVAFFPPVTGG